MCVRLQVLEMYNLKLENEILKAKQLLSTNTDLLGH